MEKFRNWVRGEPREELPDNPLETLYRSCHITAKCRYNASIRLKRQGKVSFHAAIVLSLGLVALPLLQLAGIAQGFTAPVLSAMQVFFATAVLVYSVVNSAANYGTRSHALNDCGDRLKELSRELRTAKQEEGPDVDLQAFNDRYTSITTDAENHNRIDYSRARLQLSHDARLNGYPRLKARLHVWFLSLMSYCLPLVLVAFEMVIILDALGITHILTPFLSR